MSLLDCSRFLSVSARVIFVLWWPSTRTEGWISLDHGGTDCGIPPNSFLHFLVCLSLCQFFFSVLLLVFDWVKDSTSLFSFSLLDGGHRDSSVLCCLSFSDSLALCVLLPAARGFPFPFASLCDGFESVWSLSVLLIAMVVLLHASSSCRCVSLCLFSSYLIGPNFLGVFLDFIRFDGVLYSSSSSSSSSFTQGESDATGVLSIALYCASGLVFLVLLLVVVIVYQAVILNSFFFAMPLRLASRQLYGPWARGERFDKITFSQNFASHRKRKKTDYDHISSISFCLSLLFWFSCHVQELLLDCCLESSIFLFFLFWLLLTAWILLFLLPAPHVKSSSTSWNRVCAFPSLLHSFLCSSLSSNFDFIPSPVIDFIFFHILLVGLFSLLLGLLVFAF